MTTKIETDDGAVGKSLKTTYKKDKDNDSQMIVCELNVQMPVDRRQFEALAGLKRGFVDHFYTEEGAPFADVSLLFIKRELRADGQLWRGEQQHTASLSIKKGTATNCRFKLEPNGATFICKLAWKAAGDEIEHIEHLLAQWCSVRLAFDQPADKQERLDLKPAAGERVEISTADGALPDRLAGVGYEIGADAEFWSVITPSNLSVLIEWLEHVEAAPADAESAEDPPAFVTAWLEGDGGNAAAGKWPAPAET